MGFLLDGLRVFGIPHAILPFAGVAFFFVCLLFVFVFFFFFASTESVALRPIALQYPCAPACGVTYS